MRAPARESPVRTRRPPRAHMSFPDTLALEKNAAALDSASPDGLASSRAGVFLTVRENDMCARGGRRVLTGLSRVGLQSAVWMGPVFFQNYRLTFPPLDDNIIFAAVIAYRMRKCRNWQTSKTKDLVAAMSCGFKSHLPQWDTYFMDNAGMAELADAYGSGPYGSNTMRVQVSFPAREKALR